MRSPAAFKRGMRRLASGVSIVTTIEDGVPRGLVATAVTSVSAEPSPTLLVCINRSATSHNVFARTGILCVNVLADHQADLAARFGSPHGRESRFDHCRWNRLETGAPAIVGAIASFDCEIVGRIEVQSHAIFLGEVRGVCTPKEEIAPLIYLDGRFETLRAAAAHATNVAHVADTADRRPQGCNATGRPS